jgi:glycosyltransferase involved in cell wall biosynthesis
MNYLYGKNILIISPESWSHIPVSKHHYARVLASQGNKVYFLNPPTKKNSIREEKNYPGISEVDYVTYNGINKLPLFLRNLANRIVINKIKKLCNCTFDVIWSFDPFRFQNLSLFGAKARIYHAVDIHIAPLEDELAKSSDIILAVSQMILDRFKGYPQPKLKINHGLGAHFFDLPDHINSTELLQVGYVGNLDNWCIDQTTLLSIVDRHTSVQFNFIGPYKDKSPLAGTLSQKNNCRLLGKVPSEKLPSLLSQCDIFLMCYKGDEADVNSNHHKILEYLATGKPTVINFTDEYKDRKDVVVMAEKNSELPGLFDEVVRNLKTYSSPELSEKRKAFARVNSYLNHVNTIDEMLIKTLS